jgi:hypothetical protein
VLKKTGIIASVAVAGALGLGGVAFAHAPNHDAPANTTNVQSDNTTNDCAFGQQGPLVAQDLTGGDSAVGAANPVTGLVAPITAQTQAGNCTNIVSRNETNEDSNNNFRSDSRTRVQDSFNGTSDDSADDGPFGPGFPFN